MPVSLHRAAWERASQPVLSAMTTAQHWCRVTLYSPTVLRVGRTYRMWYVGNSSATRRADCSVGYAESHDGIRWVEHKENPLLTPADLPWGRSWQTPRVVSDGHAQLYRMWFVMSDQREEQGQILKIDQRLGYASSRDGLRWDIHPEPIYPSARGPCVLPDPAGGWLMWANSAPKPADSFQELVRHIYRFTSPDGLNWTRDSRPAVTPSRGLHSVVYPFVLRHQDGYVMWYGAHVSGGLFEVFASTSRDGLRWRRHHRAPAFPAARNPNAFDGRYTSTPCVLEEEDRYLLYYSARDWGNLYGAGDGTVKADASGVYRHIGVAVLRKP